MPKLFLQDGYQIEVVEEIKLLDIIITSDLKCGKNTKKTSLKKLTEGCGW